MTVIRPCYATRTQVMRAVDIKFTSYTRDQVDRAISDASETIDNLCHRRFYNVDETHYWDWPNYQGAYPWRIWFDASELADVTSNVPVVTTGSLTISPSLIFWGPWNYSPPFTYIELNRSGSAAFGNSSTPQRDVSITGTFGYWTKTTPAGALAANAGSADITVTVTNGAAVGVGDVLNAGSERMLVTEQAMVSTGITFSSGLSTAQANDNVMAVPDSTQFSINEVLMVDSERLLLLDINGNNLIVKRAFDGTILAAHSSTTINAERLLTVTRGDLGTVPASHSTGLALTVNAPPGAVTALAVAEAVNIVQQETSGYARTVGAAESSSPATGGGLADLRDQVQAKYGRKARRRVI